MIDELVAGVAWESVVVWIVRVVGGAALISFIGSLAMVFTPRYHASQRHLFGAIACSALLLLPIAALLPGHPLPIWSRYEASDGVTNIPGAGTVSQPSTGKVPGSNTFGDSSKLDEPRPAIDGALQPLVSSRIPGWQLVDATGPIRDSQSQLDRLFPSRTTLVLGLVVYLSGVAWLAVRLLTAHLIARHLKSRAVTLPPGILGHRLECLGRTDNIRLDGTGDVTVPMAIGLWRGVVLLPSCSLGWSLQTLTAVLAHEQAHLERRDPFANLLAQIARCVYWPNPLVHWICLGMHRSQEIACDQHAVRGGCDRLAYSRALLDVAQDVTKFRCLDKGVLTMSRQDLSCRISMLLASTESKTKKGRHRWDWGAWILVGTVIGIMFLDPVAPIGITSQLLGSEEVVNTTGNRADTIEETSFKATGRVVDVEGRPIANALLVAQSYETPFALKPLELQRTDFNGQFAFEFRTNNYLLGWPKIWAYAEGYNIRCVSLATTLAIDPQAEFEGLVVPMTAAEQISFKVLKPDGLPCAGAKVTVGPVDIPHGLLMSNERTGLASQIPDEIQAILKTVTDASGACEIRSIPRNIVNRIIVESDVYGVQSLTIHDPSVDERWQLRLRNTGFVRGKVHAANLEFLTGTKVHLSTREGDVEGEVMVTLNADGMFDAEVPTGPLWLTFEWNDELDELPRLKLSQPTVQVGEVCEVEVDVQPTVTVLGCVKASDTGEPINGATVSVQSAASRLTAPTRVTTDANGHYSAKVLRGSLHQTLFLPTAYPDRYETPQIPICEIEHGPATELDPIFVKPRTIVQGKILDVAGQTINDAVVAVRPYNFLPNTYFGKGDSDASGRFQFTVVRWDEKKSPSWEWLLIERPQSSMAPPVHRSLKVVDYRQGNLILQRVD